MLTTLFNRHAPKQRVRVTKSPRLAPWLTENLKLFMRLETEGRCLNIKKNYCTKNTFAEPNSFKGRLALDDDVHKSLFPIKSNASALDDVFLAMIKYCS